MSIALLIDINLSPDWVDELSKHGWASEENQTGQDSVMANHSNKDFYTPGAYRNSKTDQQCYDEPNLMKYIVK